MTATTHALTGGVIAAAVANPVIALPTAVAVHFLIDLIPHWDIGTNFDKRSWRSNFVLTAVDVLLGYLLVFIIFSGNVAPLHLWATVIFAQLPDWIEAPYLFFNLKFAPSVWIEKIQHKLHHRATLIPGLATQAVLVIPAILLTLTSTPLQPVLTALTFFR